MVNTVPVGDLMALESLPTAPGKFINWKRPKGQEYSDETPHILCHIKRPEGRPVNKGDVKPALFTFDIPVPQFIVDAGFPLPFNVDVLISLDETDVHYTDEPVITINVAEMTTMASLIKSFVLREGGFFKARAFIVGVILRALPKQLNVHVDVKWDRGLFQPRWLGREAGHIRVDFRVAGVVWVREELLAVAPARWRRVKRPICCSDQNA